MIARRDHVLECEHESLEVLFPQLEGVHVERIERLAGQVVITAAAIGREGRCPGCGTSSTRVHSRYRRRVTDTPIGGTPVAITLGVRRLFCDAPDCPKRTFAEQIPCGVPERGRGA